MKRCINCGAENKDNRVTCIKCHTTFMKVDESKIAKKLWKLNADLRNNREALKRATGQKEKELSQAIGLIKSEIEKLVKRCPRTFQISPDGSARQISSPDEPDIPNIDMPPRKPPIKVTKGKPACNINEDFGSCPCCGEKVKYWFKQGHDGRIYGWFVNDIVPEDALPSVKSMYEVWNASGKKLSMKECIMRVRGMKIPNDDSLIE